MQRRRKCPKHAARLHLAACADLILRDAKELVAELEFVWSQIKNSTPPSSDSSPKASRHGITRHFQQPLSGSEGPLKVLSPMSEQDEAELESERRLDAEDDEDQGQSAGRSKWSRKVERAMVKLSAEVAALREQISTGREWRSRKEKSWQAWIGLAVWAVVKHLMVDFVILGIVLLWMRRRKDRRLEDLARAALRIAREYARKVLPAR
jgi:hypothetical protein